MLRGLKNKYIEYLDVAFIYFSQNVRENVAISNVYIMLMDERI